MACDDKTCKETEQIESADLPIYDKATLPDSGKLILLVDQNDYDNGGKITAAYRLPLERIMLGDAPPAVAYTLVDPDADIAVPEGEVVPAYVESFGTFDIQRAVASSISSKAKFLIIGANQNVDGGYIIQSSGFYSFPTVHGYAPGMTYYLSDSVAGGVTTTAPASIAQPLFYAVDQKTIMVMIGE